MWDSTLAKDADKRPRVGAILHHLLEALRATAVLGAPFLPETSERILVGLNLTAADATGTSAFHLDARTLMVTGSCGWSVAMVSRAIWGPRR